jgi:hypothetical protein
MMSTLTPPLKNLKDTQWMSNNVCKTSKKNCGKFCNKISKLIDQRTMDVVSRMFWEHSPVHASLSSRTSLNAKNTYFSK